MSVIQNLSDPVKHAVDGGAALTALAAIFSLLPQATALLGFIWFALRLYEGLLSIQIKKQEQQINAARLRELRK